MKMGREFDSSYVPRPEGEVWLIFALGSRLTREFDTPTHLRPPALHPRVRLQKSPPVFSNSFICRHPDTMTGIHSTFPLRCVKQPDVAKQRPSCSLRLKSLYEALISGPVIHPAHLNVPSDQLIKPFYQRGCRDACLVDMLLRAGRLFDE